MSTLLAAPEAALGPATLHDVPAMAALINGYAEEGLMLPRSEAELRRIFRDYVVVTGPEGELLACGGIRLYNPGLAEICGLAVAPVARGSGYGGTVVRALLAEARNAGVGRIFVMTLEEAFFERLGFHQVPRFRLPEKLEADCRGCPLRTCCREVAMMRTLPG